MSLLHFSGLLGYPRGFVLLPSRMRTKKSEKAYSSYWSLWSKTLTLVLKGLKAFNTLQLLLFQSNNSRCSQINGYIYSHISIRKMSMLCWCLQVVVVLFSTVNSSFRLNQFLCEGRPLSIKTDIIIVNKMQKWPLLPFCCYFSLCCTFFSYVL